MNEIDQNQKNSTSGATPSNSFHRGINEILAGNPGIGSYTRVVMTDTGETVAHSFSLSVGWGSSLRENAYNKHFGTPLPDWVKRQHPYHILQLCKLAIDHGTPLP